MNRTVCAGVLGLDTHTHTHTHCLRSREERKNREGATPMGCVILRLTTAGQDSVCVTVTPPDGMLDSTRPGDHEAVAHHINGGHRILCFPRRSTDNTAHFVHRAQHHVAVVPAEQRRLDPSNNAQNVTAPRHIPRQARGQRAREIAGGVLGWGAAWGDHWGGHTGETSPPAALRPVPPLTWRVKP